MESARILEALRPWRAKHRRTAWRPIVRDAPGPSQFGGTPWTSSDAPWPDCGICGERLTPLLQLDLASLPDRGHGDGYLQLFYCVREDCQGQGGWEPFGDDLSRVRVVRPSGPADPAPGDVELFPAKGIVAWTEMDDYPKGDEHTELGLRYTYDFKAGTVRLECPELGLDFKNVVDSMLCENVANAEAGDKLGGWPCWIQGVEYPSCPRCSKRMGLIFQLDSEHHVPFMFGDAGVGYLTQCPEHKDVVAFGWSCS